MCIRDSFHSWAPDTYEGAPLPVTAYLSVSSKATGFVALIILISKVFFASGQGLGIILVFISGITMFVGNLSALQQTNPVRLLAYSSIAQAGFILAPMAVAGITSNYEDGVYASVTYLIIYAAGIVFHADACTRHQVLRRYASWPKACG